MAPAKPSQSCHTGSAHTYADSCTAAMKTHTRGRTQVVVKGGVGARGRGDIVVEMEDALSLYKRRIQLCSEHQTTLGSDNVCFLSAPFYFGLIVMAPGTTTCKTGICLAPPLFHLLRNLSFSAFIKVEMSMLCRDPTPARPSSGFVFTLACC